MHTFNVKPAENLFVLDVNECLRDNGGCEQICNNKPGTFDCRCFDGFYLASDRQTCLSKLHSKFAYSGEVESSFCYGLVMLFEEHFQLRPTRFATDC